MKPELVLLLFLLLVFAFAIDKLKLKFDWNYETGELMLWYNDPFDIYMRKFTVIYRKKKKQ